MEKIGTILKAIRDFNHYTREHVAEQLGVDAETLYRLENAELPPKKSNIFRELCVFYGYQPHEVMAMRAHGFKLPDNDVPLSPMLSQLRANLEPDMVEEFYGEMARRRLTSGCQD